MDNIKERELVLNLIRGDENAFCKLYVIYKGRVLFFAMQYVKSKEFAEDIYQEVFTSIWKNRRFINPNLAFGPYLYTILKNCIINSIADIDKNRRLKEKIISEAIDYNNDTENAIRESELNDILEKALLKLTPQQKRVFNMSRNSLKTNKEIAEELGISVYTVQQHISTSLKIIRAYLVKHASISVELVCLLLI
jgi:RNA polymerase sigma-70 factor (ECF subfamily)